MPSVEVQYKDAAALKFLKLLSAYFGFKVVEKKSSPHESDPSTNQTPGISPSSFIPGKQDRSYEAFLTSRGLDAPTLRRDEWKRS